MKLHTNFWFLKDEKVIQPGKILILGKKPETSLRAWLWGESEILQGGGGIFFTG